jgi:cyclic pyranopterin phosphate synthase
MNITTRRLPTGAKVIEVADELPAGSHFDADGRARMVAVDQKPETARSATARARVHMAAATRARVMAGTMGKGDVLQVARLAAIGATKATSTAIPLCHPIRIVGVDVDIEPLADAHTLELRVTVSAIDRTGPEMEALHGATIGALTVYDMCKSIDRAMTIVEVVLLEKSGGKSGHFVRDP